LRLGGMTGTARLLTVAAIAGCTGLECTLLPCFDGLLINLDRSPDAGTMIEVTPLGAAPISIACDVDVCWPLLHLPNVVAQQVTVSVTSSLGAASSEFNLNYVTSEPNGRGCGMCTNAGIVVSVPTPNGLSQLH
jgi:hypothetical protein